MKDLIDERNIREKFARSIVKSYNVNYVAPNQTAVQVPTDGGAPAQQAETEAPQDAAYKADERYLHVPSSQYGTTSVEDPVTKEQIEKILGEQKNDPFEEMKELENKIES